MITRIRPYIVVAICAFMVSGCALGPFFERPLDVPEPDRGGIDGPARALAGRWRDQTGAWISLSMSGTVVGNDGCNSFQARWTPVGDGATTIQLTALSATTRACLRAGTLPLASRMTWRLRHRVLTLRAPDGHTVHLMPDTSHAIM